LRGNQKYQVTDVDMTSKIFSFLLKLLIEVKMNNTTVKLKTVLAAIIVLHLDLKENTLKAQLHTAKIMP